MTLTPPTLAARTNQTIPSLDGLRAVSVMLVLFAHFVNGNLFPGGMGVDIFFVISGFLISRLLLAEGKATGRISLPRFYARRALRLAPVVLVFTGLMVAIYLITRKPIDWLEPASAIFYFANYLYAQLPGGATTPPGLVFDQHLTMRLVPLWSLSVEEHFYLLMPATLILLRRDAKRLIAAMAAVCFACLAYRLTMARLDPGLMETNFFHFRTECRLDLLAMGVILACACELDAGRSWLARHAKPPMLAAGLVGLLACLLIRGEAFRETLRYSVEGVSIVLVISAVLISGGWIASVLNHPALRFIGRLSYSLYVWSMFGAWVGQFAAPGVFQTLTEFAVTFASALTSYSVLEAPLMKWRRRLSATAESRTSTSTGEAPQPVSSLT
ncbi:MAG: acyltransferase [Caulobacteraceae bacterium]|nr:acyltransferase [Caulobacteraceae bacterium]